MGESLKGRDVENIVCSSLAQLGLAEIQKRQIDKSIRIIIAIAIFALILSISGTYIQWCISNTPQIIENKDIKEINAKVDKINSDKKTDSLLFYMKEVYQTRTLNKQDIKVR